MHGPMCHRSSRAGGTTRRLRDALMGSAGWLDVAALIRQVLLEQAARHGVRLPLTVPAALPFPTREQWAGGGLRSSVRRQRQALRNGATVASPGRTGRVRGIGRRGHPEGVPRGEEPVPGLSGRPVLDRRRSARATRRTSRSASVRPRAPWSRLPRAAPASSACPPDKARPRSRWHRRCFASRLRGVSVLVVPTVVLTFDHERRIQKLLANPDAGGRPSPSGRYAYTGGMSPGEKQQIRDAIRDGTQRIVVTSPEAVELGLSGSLAAAAREGHLQYLIIDEAHLVDQWGSAFRPEFQALASQRLTWLSLAPAGHEVITVAMSATLTDRHIKTLTNLFAPLQVPSLTWASVTRSEPSYYLDSCHGQGGER